MANRDLLYRADVDTKVALRKMKVLNKEFTTFERQGTKSTSNVGAEVRKLGFSLERFGVRGTAAFGEIFAVLGPLGLAVGGITLGVVALTKAIASLAQLGVDVFKKITAEGVETAKSFEITRAQFTAVFEGQEEVAGAVFERIRALSRQLGTDVSETARAFIPEVGSIDELERVVKLAAALARFQPEQGATGARIALQEALSGDLRSLRRRFELPESSIDKIRQLQDELGAVDGLLQGLEEELQRTGRSLEDLSDTFEVSLGRVQERLTDLEGILGAPLTAELKEQLNEIAGLIDDNFDDLAVVGDAIGRALAGIVENLGEKIQGFLESFDAEAAEGFAISIEKIGAGINGIINALTGDALSNVDALESSLSNLADLSEKFIIIAGTLRTMVNIARDLYDTFFDIFTIVSAISTLGISTQFNPFKDNISDGLFQGFKRTDEAVQDAADAIRIYREEIDEARKAGEDFAASQAAPGGRRGDRGSSTAEADAMLTERQAIEDVIAAREELAEVLEKQAEAEEKIREKREDFSIDKERAELELKLKQTRALIDAEIKFSQEREDLVRENTERVEDIWTRHYQRVADAAIDLTRDEEDALRDASRKELEITRDSADKKIKAEADLQRRLAEIRRRFEFDAQEAIRQNDAITFLRLQRRAEFDAQEAREKRNEETADIEKSAEERRQDIKEQLALEIEDAKLANKRKLEDVQLRLRRELDAQRVKYQREIAEQALAEQRKREELNKSFAEQREDFNRSWQQRLDDLNRNLRKELQLWQQYAAQVKAILRSVAAAARRTDSRRRESGDSDDDGNTESRSTGKDSDKTTSKDEEEDIPENANAPGIPGRARGGGVGAGQDYIVGEDGPEIFRPDRHGRIIPNNLLFRPPVSGGYMSRVDNRRINNIDMSLLDPTHFTPTQIAILRSIVQQEILGST